MPTRFIGSMLCCIRSVMLRKWCTTARSESAMIPLLFCFRIRRDPLSAKYPAGSGFGNARAKYTLQFAVSRRWDYASNV